MRIRRHVDRDLVDNYRPISPFYGLLLLAGVALGGAGRSNVLGVMLWIMASAICVLWTTFVGWRTVRLWKATGLRGDRDYDRRLKLLLPPEYASTESATTGRRKRRRS